MALVSTEMHRISTPVYLWFTVHSSARFSFTSFKMISLASSIRELREDELLHIYHSLITRLFFQNEDLE